MLEISTARSGQQTARVAGTHIHSPYDPRKEAQRFVRQQLEDKNPSLILLLGAGLGYLHEELGKAFPAARIVTVFYSRLVWEAASSKPPPGSFWHPGQNESLLGFLRRSIHELEAEGLSTVEWPPSARIFPGLAKQADRALHQLLREIRGTLVTTSAMGKLWLKNSLLNFLGIEEIYPPPAPRSGPLVIAASGPSLEEASDFLLEHRHKIELWALPSALLFLLSRGLMPDTVIMTDPSYYAFSHLQCAKDQQLHLSMPLSAARGSWRIATRVALLNQDTPVERMLLQQGGISAETVPAQGTVAATALLLALRKPNTPVILAGLDFCYRDIASHVRPNNFETWLARGSNRLDSLYNRLFVLAADKTQGGREGERANLALDTYAGWFAEIGRSSIHDGRKSLQRLNPSEVRLPGIQGIDESGLARLIGSSPAEAHSPSAVQAPLPRYPSGARRAKIVSNLLADWLRRTDSIASAISAKSTLEPLMKDSESLSLIYLCNAAELTETRRILRLRGMEAAVRKTGAVLKKHRQMLSDLAEQLRESR